MATGEWRPGVWWHIGRREGGTSSGVERRHQMDYEDRQRGRSESIVEFDLGVSKVDDDESGHWNWIA